MMRFRVATYNVHKCQGIDWRVSADRVAAVIAELRADIVALQEVTQSQAAVISDQLSTPFLFGCARQHKAEPYGNAVFTRRPVLSTESYNLTVAGREPRQCLRVCVACDVQPMQLFAVHLGTSSSERRSQARRLLSPEILNNPEFQGRRIVAGDFNEWTIGLATQLLSDHLKSADLSRYLKRCSTYPGLLPFLHLDHFYYDSAFHLHQLRLHRTRLSLLASDHLPLVADFSEHDS